MGPLGKNQRDLANALELAAFSAKGRHLGEALVRWIVPWFAKLSKEGRESWWVGLHTLASPETREHIGESIWSAAAANFGKTVECELKAEIFRPFKSTHDPQLPTDAEGRVLRQYVGWRRSLDGRGMLGDMINCLSQARSPNHKAARMLKEWLSERHPGLLSHLKKSRQMKELVNLRNRAQHESHESVGEFEARQMYKVASDFLKVLVLRKNSIQR